MKIAELFVQLGFKVDGDGRVDDVDRRMNKATVSALGLLAGVTALNAAFYAFVNRGVAAAVALDQFHRASGVATDDLQRIQGGAARLNVSAGTIAEAIKTIQKTRAEISLGNADASSPWFLLGIDPRQDPVRVIDQLRESLQRLDPALARTMASRMGFGDDFLYFLQQKKGAGSILVSPREIERLAALGGAWRAFLFNVSTLATKFAASFADGLARVVGWLERGTIALERFARWLNGATTGAAAARGVLMGVVALLGVLAVVLTGVVALLAGLKALLIAIQLIPIVAAMTALVALVLLLGAAIVGLVLLVQDFWTQIDGGKSLFDWNQNLVFTVKNVERLAKAMQWALDVATKLGAEVKRHVTQDRGYGFGALGEFIAGNPAGYAAARFASPNIRHPGPSSTSNSAKVEIVVDGAGDPGAVGREVSRTVGREVSDAFGAMPIPVN